MRAMGWVPDKPRQNALAAQAAPFQSQLDDLPVDMNKSCFPIRVLANALKKSKYTDGNKLKSRNQGSHGSCVGHGTARLGANNLAADILVRGLPYEWPTANGKPLDVSPSWVYGASREVVGQLGTWEGSNGSWAVQALRDWGMLFETTYGDLDLTSYKEKDCDQWEASGVPPASKQYASAFRFQSFVRIDTVEQWVALIQNFYTATCCCQLAWDGKLIDGYMKQAGSWAHCQHGGGAYVAKPQRGILIQNSWGTNWMSGTPHPMMKSDMPAGSYFIFLKDAQKLLDAQDTWTVTGGRGIVPAPRPWREKAFDV